MTLESETVFVRTPPGSRPRRRRREARRTGPPPAHCWPTPSGSCEGGGDGAARQAAPGLHPGGRRVRGVALRRRLRARRKIADLQLRTGAETVNLIAHSQGGITARTYIHDYGCRAVERPAGSGRLHLLHEHQHPE